MNLQFSIEENRFRDEVRTWLAENKPRESRPVHGDAMVEYDRAWQRRQYDAGWAGIAWPKEYGGRGLSLIEQLIWFEEYARAGAPTIGVFYVAVNHGGPTLIARGSEEQKAFHLEKILRGEAVWSQGFSEPGAGSDLASLRARAEIDGDHLVVNGQKIWTTYGQYSQYQELLVRTDPAVPKHKGISWVICDMDTPGIDVCPIECMDGSEHFCEVFYNDVRIPLGNVVGGMNNGWATAMATLGFERGTAALADQIELAGVVDELIELARHRGVLGIDDIGANLAKLKAEVMALRAMGYATISRALHTDVPGAEATMISLFMTEANQRVHRVAMDILGMDNVERPATSEGLQGRYLTSFMQTIGGGTSEIRRNIIGERVLGLPKSK
ncbi:MAG: acyl-CoA dehydrogenase family protein [Pseudoxanthomonas sp.]